MIYYYFVSLCYIDILGVEKSVLILCKTSNAQDVLSTNRLCVIMPPKLTHRFIGEISQLLHEISVSMCDLVIWFN